jgi:hypothetical protein
LHAHPSKVKRKITCVAKLKIRVAMKSSERVNQCGSHSLRILKHSDVERNREGLRDLTSTYSKKSSLSAGMVEMAYSALVGIVG